jgi:hypothetical protein
VFVGFTSLIFATFSTDARRKIVLSVTCIITGLPSFLHFVTRDMGVYMVVDL